MKYTLETINNIISEFEKLSILANQYINRDDKYNNSKTRINYDTMTIEERVNTACNCHPEYNWEYVDSIENMIEWTNNNNNK